MSTMQGSLEVKKYKNLGLVVSRWNAPVTDLLKAEALKEFENLGVSFDNLNVVSVPGAYEIPYAAQSLLDNGAEGVVCLGAVIRGETTHYDYVCNSVERGCSGLQLEYKAPVVFGVLTTENGDQAFARANGTKENKGKECVHVLFEMLNLKELIKN